MNQLSLQGSSSKSAFNMAAAFAFLLIAAVTLSILITRYQWKTAAGLAVLIFVGFVTISWNYRMMLFLILLTLISTSSNFVLGDSTYYLRFLLIGCFSGWEMLLILRRRKIIISPSYMHFAMFFLIIICFASSSYSIERSISFQRSFSLLLLYIAVFVSIWNHCENRERMESIFRLLSYTTMGILVWGTVMLIANPGGFFMGGRFQSVFSNPNAIGAFCTLFTPLIYWIYSRAERKTLMRYLSGGLIFVSLFNIVLSGSRASLLGTSLAMLIVFWSTSRMKLFIAVTVIVVSVAVLFNLFGITPASFGVGTYVGDKLIRYGTIETGSGRSFIWEQGWNLFMDKPLSGWGWGLADYMFQIGMVEIGLEFTGLHFHNSYLEYLINVGIFGAVPFFTSLLYVLLCGIRLIRMNINYETRILAVVLLGSFAGGMLNAFFESWMVSVGSPFMLPFWLIGVLLVKLYSLEKSGNSEAGSSIPMELKAGDLPSGITC